MPVNIPCADYTDNEPLWRLVRDCVKGESAVKVAKEAYLPKLAGQTDNDYKAYSSRVHFFDATGRTAEGLHGNIFSRNPVQTGDIPSIFADFIDNVDKAGSSINQFAADLCWDIMQTGWGGILVDHSPMPGEDVRVDTAERMRLTSFMRWYPAESLINWRYDTVDDKKSLSLAVLKEAYAVGGDEFNPGIVYRYRVLRLNGGIYTQQIYEQDPDTLKYHPAGEPITPILDGEPLGYIPFFPCPGSNPEKSMLLGLAYENIGHYQKSADLENDLHFTGVHTPYVTGMDAPTDKNGNAVPISIGGSNFLFFPGENIRVGYLEASGSNTLIEAIDKAEDRMSMLGAKIISREKKGVETAEAARIHMAGENAVLGAFARNMSERLTLAARLGARWRGVPEEITEQWSITLNVDYEGDLSQEDEKRLGILEVENGLMSKERYLREFDAMDEQMAREELEAIKAEAKTEPLPEADFRPEELEGSLNNG